MARKIVIKGKNKDEDIFFWIHNQKSDHEIENSLFQYTYNNLVFVLLILAKDYQKSDNDEIMKYFEHLEENRLYLASGSVDFISKRFTELKYLASDLEQIYNKTQQVFEPNYNEKIKTKHQSWVEIQTLSKKVLDKLGITPRTDLNSSEENLDDSFLF